MEVWYETMPRLSMDTMTFDLGTWVALLELKSADFSPNIEVHTDVEVPSVTWRSSNAVGLTEVLVNGILVCFGYRYVACWYDILDLTPIVENLTDIERVIRLYEVSCNLLIFLR